MKHQRQQALRLDGLFHLWPLGGMNARTCTSAQRESGREIKGKSFVCRGKRAALRACSAHEVPAGLRAWVVGRALQHLCLQVERSAVAACRQLG